MEKETTQIYPLKKGTLLVQILNKFTNFRIEVIAAITTWGVTPLSKATPYETGVLIQSFAK